MVLVYTWYGIYQYMTYGKPGEQLEKWFKNEVKEMGKEADADIRDQEGGSWTADTFGAFWKQRFSVALQKGNAHMICMRGARDSTTPC